MATVILGDSHVAGEFIRAAFRVFGDRVSVTCLYGSRTSDWTRERLESVAFAPGDTLLVFLGSNDFFRGPRTETIATFARDHGLPLLWVGPPAVRGLRGRARDALASRLGDRYFDTFELDLILGPDGVHPPPEEVARWLFAVRTRITDLAAKAKEREIMSTDEKKVWKAGDRRHPSEPYVIDQTEADARNAAAKKKVDAKTAPAPSRAIVRADTSAPVPAPAPTPDPAPAPALPAPAPIPAPPAPAEPPAPSPAPPVDPIAGLSGLEKDVETAHAAYRAALDAHTASAAQEASDRAALNTAALAAHAAVVALVAAAMAEDPT